ncbi:MAG TPA: S24 family peptidase [Candidatus Acidoferrum sp.]|nr:S24 family peptidase [Candidatus Acidoferrum sp.]
MRSSFPYSVDEQILKGELAREVLRSCGALRLSVTGWSMLPTIWPGETLVIERVGFDAVKKGDIVFSCVDGRFFVHRVIEKKKAGADSVLLTRGDGMAQVDPPVSGSEVLGRVSFILRDGHPTEPVAEFPFPKRVVTALIRRSHLFARLTIGIHTKLQTYRRRISDRRVILCQS